MDDLNNLSQGFSCPLPVTSHESVQFGHGSGGRMTHELITGLFQKYLGNEFLNPGNDGAILPGLPGKNMVISTDAHIVSPLFFPGGDIGRLAVCGTVNDVAMMGAEPVWLTASFIIEEGFCLSDLEKILISMSEACREAAVQIVAGDTKVTERGSSDGLFISTTGFGWLSEEVSISGENAQPGDAVIISGQVGNHGIAVLQARETLGFSSHVRSDVAPLNRLIAELLKAVPDLHVLRDPTRGGLATTLVEIATQSGVSILLDEAKIPIDPEVKSISEMLGLDPLYLANEGKFILILPEVKAEKALQILRANNYGQHAALIGHVTEKSKGKLALRTSLGTTRALDMLTAEMLPRIC